MTTVFLAPAPINVTQFIPGSNLPAAGAKLFSYAAGTSTKVNTYTTSSGTVAWSNPNILDSGGNFTGNGEVWLLGGQVYDFVLAPSTDTDPPVSPFWTKQSISGINDPSNSLSEWVASGSTVTFVNASTFTMVGDVTSILTLRRRLRTVNTSGTLYSSVSSSVFSASTTTIGINSDSTGLDSGLSSLSYALLGTKNDSLPYALTPQRFGAKGGTTDDTTAFTNAISAANSLWQANGSDQYSEVQVMIPDGSYTAGGGTGIVMLNGVVLVGQGRPHITAASTGVMFTDSASNSSSSPGFGGGIVNLQLHGLGASSSLVCIKLNYVQNFRAENIRIDNFADQGVQILNGNTNKFRDVIAFNCVINTTRAAIIGGFEVAGTDHEFTNCEYFNSLATRPGLSSGSKFLKGWVVNSVASHYIGCKGSVTDQGLYVSSAATNNHFLRFRADGDYAEGIVIDGSASVFSDFEVLNCCQDANNTYDGISLTVNTQNNVLESGTVFSNASTTNKPRFGIADTGNTASRPNRYNMGSILIFNAVSGMVNNSGLVNEFTYPKTSPTTVTASTYTVTDQDYELIFNRAGTISTTLPDASKQGGRTLRLRTIQNQFVVSASSNVVPLVGGAAGTPILSSTAGKWVEINSDGTNWQTMAGN